MKSSMRTRYAVSRTFRVCRTCEQMPCPGCMRRRPSRSSRYCSPASRAHPPPRGRHFYLTLARPSPQPS
eukprot:7720223-Alexandrium_andersonii.AAC.1